MQTYPLEELASLVDAKLNAKAKISISMVASLRDADKHALSYVRDKKFVKYLKNTTAGAVLVSEEFADQSPVPTLVVDNPELAFAKIAALFSYKPNRQAKIHPSAVVGEHCSIAADVSIAANCVIGDHVKIAARTKLYPGTIIDDYCEIGEDCLLYANVTLYHHVKLANQVIVHSGTVIGADGFGLVQAKDKHWEKVPQLGGVVIGNDVEIGANTCIDRGALQDTVIHDGVKLDNQIQIAHNVEVGQHTVIAGSTGVAGSTKIGAYCQIGGAVGIRDNVTIGDNIFIAAASNVAWSLTKPGMYASGFVAVEKSEWINNIKRFYQLNDMYKRFKTLEKSINEYQD